jgi:hypothetical protein
MLTLANVRCAKMGLPSDRIAEVVGAGLTLVAASSAQEMAVGLSVSVVPRAVIADLVRGSHLKASALALLVPDAQRIQAQ